MPWLTLLAAILLAVVYFTPLAQLLIYERAAVYTGQWWRLGTPLLVHYSPSHLCWNLLILIPWGTLLEIEDRGAFVSILTFTAVAHALLLFFSDIPRFAGASGWGVAMVAYCCLSRWATRCRQRRLWLLLLVSLVAKIGYEFVAGRLLFAAGDFRPLPEAHAAGFVCAMLVFLCVLRRDGSGRKGMFA